jgi:glycosyltransferase involved in cell wall biosynthesis
MLHPFFSIIIPIYNREKKIAKAIQSVLDQTFQDFELIVVDDCSLDNSAQKVFEIQQKDSRIKYLKNEHNLERCETRNKGVLAAQGKYICFLDSDDYHLPNHLETFYKRIQLEQYPKGFFFSSSWNETENGIRSERTCPPVGNLNMYHYFLNYTVNPQRWCVESSVAKTILFDPQILICEDMDFSLRIVEKGYPIFQILDRTTVYVAAEDSFTHGDSNKWEKELFYLKRIFEKPELKKYLPQKDKHRLLSICYYHLSGKNNKHNQKFNTIKFALKSIYLYPYGYKKGITKDLVILLIVSFPFSRFIKSIFFKRR